MREIFIRDAEVNLAILGKIQLVTGETPLDSLTTRESDGIGAV